MKQLSEQITMLNAPQTIDRLCAGCTLFEGNFHFGLGALVNSLYRNGCRGVFYAGYRGELPPWTNGNANFAVAEGLEIKFLKLDTPIHFTFCKAMLIEKLLDEVRPELDTVLYFDPDIVVKCPWNYLTAWAEDRVALCQDVNWNFPSTHPVRRDWDRYLNPLGFFPKHEQNFYYNAGFVGIARSRRKFLLTWEAIMQAVGPLVGNRIEISFRDVNFFFHKADQDSLNLAADIFPEMVSAMGPEAMDFVQGGHTMSHAVGSSKPWNSHFLRNALGGRSPSKTDKEFIVNAQAPIRIFTPAVYIWRLFRVRLAAAITRFVRRN